MRALLISKLYLDSIIHIVPINDDSIFMIDLYLMRRFIGTSKDKILTESFSTLLGQDVNFTTIAEDNEDDEVNCQDYFNVQEALLLKIIGDDSDETSILMKYQDEKIKVNDLDVTEVR